MRAIATLVFALLLASCASQPRTQEERAAWFVNRAKETIAQGKTELVGSDIEYSLGQLTGPTLVREMFAAVPRANVIYRDYLEQYVDAAQSFESTVTALTKLNGARRASLLAPEQFAGLRRRLADRVIAGNLQGTIFYDMSISMDFFPELNTPQHQAILLERTLANLQTDRPSKTQVAALMKYVETIGRDSMEGQRIEALLPRMNFRRAELVEVAKQYPDFAEKRLEGATLRVFLEVKNADRLAADDVLSALREKIIGVDWVPSPGPKITTLTIERVRNDEKTLSEQTQTITYSQYEVNLIEAMLLMPRNASFRYEFVTGGAEIDYGYVVKATRDGTNNYEQVVRGKVSGESRRCINPRIQNVFGGVTAAGFVANSDMANRCSGSTSVSMESLRKDVFSKLVEGVLNVPSIKVVHAMN
ncbi:MAG: hypothetical protein H7232_06725 [Aeromicrobium sp.]|nr:hypothetical protein [Burkholderiales bacterium]